MGISIRPGLSVKLVTADQGGPFVSQVLGRNKYGITLSLPEMLGKIYVLPAGAELTCSIVVNDQLMEFKSHVMGYERTTPPVMVMADPDHIEEKNRRDAFRLQLKMAVSYIAEGEFLKGERTRTIDVSMGGLQMVTVKPLAPGTNVVLTLELPDQSVTLSGRVMWSGFKGTVAVAGVRYTGGSDAGQTALNRFLLKTQREMFSATK